MSALTGVDDLVRGMLPPLPIQKASVSSAVAGGFQSLWTAAGNPAAGSTGGAACDETTNGALWFPSLTAGQSAYLARAAISSSVVGTVILYDRLVHTSALAGNVNTLQSFTTASLPRYTTGLGVEAWLEWYTATGTGTPTVAVSYTNSDGTSGRSASAFGGALTASVPASRMVPLALQAGDKGVRSVESLQLSVATSTAGNFGITLLKRLAALPCNTANVKQLYNWASLGCPFLGDYGNEPCLAMMVFTSTTTTGNVLGEYTPSVA